jgi:hypothetical protein
MFLTIVELCRDDRPLAGFGVFGKVILHAGLNAAAARLDTGASPLDIGFADFDHRHIAHESLLAGFGKPGEMLLDARSDPAVTGLNAGAMLLKFEGAGLGHGCLLCHSAGRGQQENRREGGADYFRHDLSLSCYSSDIPASRRPLK